MWIWFYHIAKFKGCQKGLVSLHSCPILAACAWPSKLRRLNQWVNMHMVCWQTWIILLLVWCLHCGGYWQERIGQTSCYCTGLAMKKTTCIGPFFWSMGRAVLSRVFIGSEQPRDCLQQYIRVLGGLLSWRQGLASVKASELPCILEIWL